VIEGTQAARHRHQSIHRLRVHRRLVERRAGRDVTRARPAWTSKFKEAERLPLDLIASRLPDEEVFFQKMTALVWEMTQTMFFGGK
jgi:hypothetical protein